MSRLIRITAAGALVAVAQLSLVPMAFADGTDTGNGFRLLDPFRFVFRWFGF